MVKQRNPSLNQKIGNDIKECGIMAILTIEVLKKLIENIPDDFTVEYDKGETTTPIDDRVEIDIGCKQLIFK